MTTLLLVFVTLRVITAAISVEVSGEDIPSHVSFLQQVLRTGFWVLGAKSVLLDPRIELPLFLAFSGPAPFLEGKHNCKGTAHLWT